MHCPNCGQEILEGSEFCGNCGARIEHRPVGMTCAKCGTLNLPEADFCTECGARLGGEAVPMQSFCPECGAAVKEGAAFCPECGASLKVEAAPVQSFCPECGALLDPDAVFCGNCGRILQPQPQPQQQNWEPVQTQQQDWAPQPQVKTQPQKSNRNKMLMAAAAAVVLLVIGITGFWKPGFLLDMFRPTAKLENGTLALNDITLDFKQTNLKNGAATLTTVKNKEEEVHNGLIGDLYVMKYDKSCQGKVTVAVPVPKDFKPTNDEGVYIKLGIGRDYLLADGKTTRYYEYFDATIKDGKAVAVIDPATAGLGRHKSKTSAKPAEKAPDLGEFTEYVGIFYKQVGVLPKVLLGEGYNYGEGYQYTKGHFRLWYSYNILLKSRNTYMGGDDAQRLLGDLEEAYNYYKTHGFDDYVDAFTPIDVYIEDTDDEGGWFPKSGNMQLRERTVFGGKRNERYEGDRRTNVKKTIYHEFFHAVQQGIHETALWFDEATATHFERVVDPDVVPENGQSFSRLMWSGLIPENNTQEEGYGRELLIQYISSKMGGDEWIKDCYKYWTADCYSLKSVMKRIAGSEANFAADFYREVITKIGHLPCSKYYNASKKDPDIFNEGYLSEIKLKLDEKTKEKIKNGEEDAFPAVFFSPSFELGGYGGHVVVLDMEEDSLPDKCQLKLEADGGSRLQVIKFKNKTNNGVSSNETVIKNLKEELKKDYLYLVLVTSTQPTKQNIRLKATLEKEELEEGIYNGKATMTEGKKTQTTKNGGFFRLSRLKDRQWSLCPCDKNGNYPGEVYNIPLTYDAKQQLWKGHRKFKENVSKDPNFPKIETGTFDYTMKVNLEGKEPVLIIKVKSEGTSWKWGFPTKEKYEIKFEGKWVSELKGRNLNAGKEGKVIILE